MKVIYAAASPTLQRWFWWLLLLNLLFIFGSKFYLKPLTSAEIVRFEVAKITPVAEGILQEWKSSGKYEKAVQSIYIDYLFIILYVAGLSVSCAYVSRLTGHEILIRAGKGLSYLLAIAGICDVIENVTMMKSLHGALSPWNVMLSYDMAAAKFSVIIISLLFLLVCFLFYLANLLFEKR
jgi:hypothetical protein